MNCILIIDKTEDICTLLKKRAETENIKAHTCHIGKDGLELLQANDYQIVVFGKASREKSDKTANLRGGCGITCLYSDGKRDWISFQPGGIREAFL